MGRNDPDRWLLKLGKVQASVLVRSLLKSERPSGLTQAIIEVGRINKTLYLLNYIDDEDYRRRILTQLNRGESRHAVARAICHGQKGEIRKRYTDGQEDQLGALGLVTNASCYGGAGAVWKSAHLAGRRCRGESAHLAGRRCRVGIRPPCRAPVLCGNSPIFMTKICQMTGSCVLIYVRRDFAYQLLEKNFPESSILYLASKGVSLIYLLESRIKERFNSAKFFCWDSGKRKRSFNQA
ncbi:Tn3 family transposase [Escherichia coli]|uniref:Tn3 family transposase n=1 Tax=Escherichia coli TaxID=562 RepID=UPI003B5CAC9A